MLAVDIGNGHALALNAGIEYGACGPAVPLSNGPGVQPRRSVCTNDPTPTTRYGPGPINEHPRRFRGALHGTCCMRMRFQLLRRSTLPSFPPARFTQCQGALDRVRAEVERLQNSRIARHDR
jgi:hypothetical protein